MYQTVTKVFRGLVIALVVSAMPVLGQLNSAWAQEGPGEIVIGEAEVAPGIVLIFEAALRDVLQPRAQNLDNDLTDIHIEARANWDEDENNTPDGTPPGGFVAYLNVNAVITNEETGDVTFATLIPMVNLIDNFHYARNIKLPGDCTDIYSVAFAVNPPDKFELTTHQDWRDDVDPNSRLMPQNYKGTFTGQDFSSNCRVDR